MEDLVNSLNELRKSTQLCDVKIISKNSEHFAHRVILAASSKFFRIMFQNGFKESYSGVVKFTDTESSIMEGILSFMYTCDIDINDDNAVELYRMADQLQMNKLIKRCSKYLMEQLSTSCCLDLYRLGQTFMNTEMKKASFDFMVSCFNEFTKSEEFYELTVDEIIAIIRQDELNVDKEEDIYEAVLSWADKDPGKRDALLPEIMQYIRFPLMDLDFLEINVLNNSRIKDKKWNKLIYDIYHRCCRYYKHNEKHALFLMPASMPCYSRKHRIPSKIIYVYGGWNKGRSLDITECYNYKNDQWTICQKLNDPAGGKCYYGLAQINQLIYFAGGYDGQSYLNTVRTYEPISKRWSEIAPMHTKRCFTCLVSLQDKLYAIAGFDGAKRLATVEEYCPKSNQWTFVCPLSTSRSDSAVVARCGNIYVIGGYSGDSLRSVEVYDCKGDSWKYVAPLNTRRSGAGAIILPDGRIFVIGGYDGVSRQKTTEFYDAETDIWINGPSMFEGRSNFAVSIIGKYVYAIGGYTGQNTINQVERYDIEENNWTKLAKMHCSRSAMKSVVLTGLKNFKDYIWLGMNDNVEDYLHDVFGKDFDNYTNNNSEQN